MDKAMRGHGCVMKRQKKSGGGAMRAVPDNLKNYIREKKTPPDREMKEEGKPKRKFHKLPKMAKSE